MNSDSDGLRQENGGKKIRGKQQIKRLRDETGTNQINVERIQKREEVPRMGGET